MCSCRSQLVYQLPDLPDSPSGKMNLIVCSLQALFYALEVAERAVSESHSLASLSNRLLSTPSGLQVPS